MSLARSRPPLLALVLAVLLGAVLAGGTAYAAPLGAKQVKKIAAKVVKKQAPSLSVASAQTAQVAQTAKTADSATKATTADNATSADRAKALDGYEIRSRSDQLAGNATNYNGVALACPAGKKAVGGGATMSSFDAAINQSAPSADGAAWDVDVVRLSGNTAITITTRVICIPA